MENAPDIPPPFPVNGTTWCSSVLRLYGAEVGAGCFFPSGVVHVDDPTFARIGNNVTFDHNSLFRQHSFEDGLLKWGPNFIGSDSSLMQGTLLHMSDMGEGVILHPGSVTWKGLKLEDGCEYSGKPAERS